MEETLHQLIGSLSHYLQDFYTSQVVQDFFHQQYHEGTFDKTLDSLPSTSYYMPLRKTYPDRTPAFGWFRTIAGLTMKRWNVESQEAKA